MNNAIAVMKRPLFFIPISLLLLAIIVVLSLPKNETLSDTAIYNQSISPETAKKYDQQKVNSLYDMVSRIVGTYAKLRQNYPSSDSDGWASVMEDAPVNNSFIDPYTESFYTYIDLKTDPDFGQIQYAPGKICDKSSKLKEGGFRTLALRVRTYNTYKCVSTLDVQFKK